MNEINLKMVEILQQPVEISTDEVGEQIIIRRNCSKRVPNVRMLNLK
jgi:hypothetical protein